MNRDLKKQPECRLSGLWPVLCDVVKTEFLPTSQDKMPPLFFPTKEKAPAIFFFCITFVECSHNHVLFAALCIKILPGFYQSYLLNDLQYM